MQTRAYWNNYNMTFRDETYGPSAGSSLWQTCPLVAHLDPSLASTFYDDFWSLPCTAIAATDGRWGLTEDAGKTGTDAMQDMRGGVWKLFCGGTNNEETYLHTIGESWILTAGHSLWFEARVAVVEASTNEANFWIGLTDVEAANQIADTNAGPIGTYFGVGFFKTGGALTTVGFETSNGTTQSTSTSQWTVVSSAFRNYGCWIKTESTSDTVAVCTPYVDGVAGTAHNITLASLAEMEFVVGLKTGSTDAEDALLIDYVKIVQIRN